MINAQALKEALKRTVAADRALHTRAERLENKRAEASELFEQAKSAPNASELSTLTKKLNRANAIVDQMTERSHNGTAELAEELDKLIELAQQERAKLK